MSTLHIVPTLCIKALRKRPDEITVCLPSSFFDVFTRRVRDAVCDIVVYAPRAALEDKSCDLGPSSHDVQKRWVLRYHADARSPRLDRKVADI